MLIAKWSELTNDEKNRLIHEEVMGIPTMCNGRLTTWKVDVPSRAGGIAWTHDAWKCDTCTAQGNGDAPKEHVCVVDIPDYTTSMDAALLVANHPKFCAWALTKAPVLDPGKGLYSCTLFWRAGEAVQRIEAIADTPQEAICWAALRFSGVEVEL